MQDVEIYRQKGVKDHVIVKHLKGCIGKRNRRTYCILGLEKFCFRLGNNISLCIDIPPIVGVIKQSLHWPFHFEAYKFTVGTVKQ